eukprot:NODE_206_length_12919_cov_0.381357.p2 type:complete len:548 gc:universal NODE_206_length_12919_cov_0.381357:8869-10512(+)
MAERSENHELASISKNEDQKEKLLNEEEITLTWHDIKYTITKKKKDTTLLAGISGEVKAGEMVAILGSSGAGKSTLLNVLSGRVNTGKIEGQVLVNGQPRDPKIWTKQCNVVEQDDMFYATTTVKDAIAFSGKLRLPKQSPESLNKTVDTTIEELGLIHVKNTRIGDAIRRGISGGERKRCAIGVELVTNPKLLFLDEPTTGLDSFIAYNIIQTLKNLAARENRSILMTIHQPRETIVALFDKIMLLSKGRCIFFGNIQEALDYFSKNGFPCPENTNPANFFIDLITIDYRTEEKREKSENRINKLIENWKQHDFKAKYPKIQEYHVAGGHLSFQYNSTWLYEFGILFKRSLKETTQNPAIVGITIVQSLFQLLLLGVVFNNLDKSQKGIQNRIGFVFFLSLNLLFTNVMPTVNTFPLLRSIISRERRSGMYRASSAFLARLLSVFPLITFQWAFFVIPIYWILGMDPAADKYVIYFVAAYLHQIFACCLGLMIGSAVPVILIYIDSRIGSGYRPYSSFVDDNIWRFGCEFKIPLASHFLATIPQPN